MSLVKEIYLITQDLPSEEKFGLISQIRRCAVSIPSNIAEGAGRNNVNEFIQFLGIASGSAYELETQLILLFELNFKTEKKSPAFYTAAKKIESILSFIAVYAKDHNYHKIIVAGGETSGAVTTGLGYSSFYIGQEICPGVPVLIPEENRYLQLILKSGNFGSEDFFLKAMEM